VSDAPPLWRTFGLWSAAVKMSRVRLSVVGAVLALVSVAFAAPADAKAAGHAKSGSSTVGNDISYPQCGKPYPGGQAFGIVGLNGGLANNNNKCFADEFAWAQKSSGAVASQPKASIYINTGNPSGAGPLWWPTSNTFYHTADTIDTSDGTDPTVGPAVQVPTTSAYGSCSLAAADDKGCAYVYGWAKAYEDFNFRNVANPATLQWWLDVETSNSWETPGSTYPTAYVSNQAALRGMIDYFATQSMTTTTGTVPVHVGIYSTTYQWGQITGSTSSADQTDPFAGVPNWQAGASSTNASTYCASNFTYGSKVQLVQYVAGRFDYDIACP
jgi:hypothetical protein